ncbi:hypothetical protein Bca4012_064708 [Brassica carinata]
MIICVFLVFPCEESEKTKSVDVCVCVSYGNSGALNGLNSSENAAPADAKNLCMKIAKWSLTAKKVHAL